MSDRKVYTGVNRFTGLQTEVYMPARDPAEYMRDRRAREKAANQETGEVIQKPSRPRKPASGEQPLGEFIVDHLVPEGVDAILAGIHAGSAEAWRMFETRVGAGKIDPTMKPVERPMRTSGTAVPKTSK
jgi:hypothetical protein